MQPTIQDGDAVTVGPVDPADVTCGDILLYRRRQRAIVTGWEKSAGTPDTGICGRTERGWKDEL